MKLKLISEGTQETFNGQERIGDYIVKSFDKNWMIIAQGPNGKRFPVRKWKHTITLTHIESGHTSTYHSYNGPKNLIFYRKDGEPSSTTVRDVSDSISRKLSINPYDAERLMSPYSNPDSIKPENITKDQDAINSTVLKMINDLKDEISKTTDPEDKKYLENELIQVKRRLK